MASWTATCTSARSIRLPGPGRLRHAAPRALNSVTILALAGCTAATASKQAARLEAAKPRRFAPGCVEGSLLFIRISSRGFVSTGYGSREDERNREKNTRGRREKHENRGWRRQASA